MSAFWNSFAVLETTSVGLLGEPVIVNGVASVGVMQPTRRDLGAVSGGTRYKMEFEVLVTADVEAGDGDEVTMRGITGVIYGIEMISASSKVLHCGPLNRWDV